MHATITILGCGTSTGVPVPGCECAVCTSTNEKNKRLRSSALISTASGEQLLIDTSTDLRAQALRAKISKLDAILYTHYHSDHVLGLEDIRGYNFKQNAPIPCYASNETYTELKKIFNYIFYPDPLYLGGQSAKIEERSFAYGESFMVQGKECTPFRLIHGNMTTTGFRFGELAYATDCKSFPPESLAVVKGVKFLVLDALRYEPHQSHLTIPEAIELATQIGAERTVFTHMTHTVEYEAVSKQLPKGIELAYDGLQIAFEW